MRTNVGAALGRGATIVLLGLVVLLLLLVGLLSHGMNVVEASYECPVVGGDPGQLQYTFFDGTYCLYDDDPAMTTPTTPTKQPLDWFDPLGSALVLGIGTVVVIAGGALALGALRRRWAKEDAEEGLYPTSTDRRTA